MDKVIDPATPVVTEEELRKSLAALEGVAPVVTPPAVPVVETPGVAKAADKIKAGSEELRKALEVSPILKEVTTLLGAHVDTSLETLQKAVHESAQRDLAVIRVLEVLKKAIDGLVEKVATIGAQPGAPVTPPFVASSSVLKKGTDGAVDPVAAKATVLRGLEKLAKSAVMGSVDQSAAIQATAMFESTGQIKDEMLQKALAATKA